MKENIQQAVAAITPEELLLVDKNLHRCYQLYLDNESGLFQHMYEILRTNSSALSQFHKKYLELTRPVKTSSLNDKIMSEEMEVQPKHEVEGMTPFLFVTVKEEVQDIDEDFNMQNTPFCAEDSFNLEMNIKEEKPHVFENCEDPQEAQNAQEFKLNPETQPMAPKAQLHLRNLLTAPQEKVHDWHCNRGIYFTEEGHGHMRQSIRIKMEGSDAPLVPVHSKENEERTFETGISSELIKTEDCPRKQEDERPFKCAWCEMQFNLQEELHEHKKVHSRENHVCHICTKSFSRLTSLNAHLRSHTWEKLHACEICGKSYDLKSSLSKHKMTHSEKRYTCKICGKGFSWKCEFNGHKGIHTGERPFVCKVCGKGFTVEYSLNVHARIHTGERPFACKTCGKSFIQKSNLKTHEKIHTGERPYVCKTCGKGFTQKSNLEEHTQIHSGERPYVCKICGKSFSKTRGLKAHRQIHTGERPYQCKICGKGFIQKSNLNKHENIHDGERPNVCEVCGKRFSWKGALEIHRTIHIEEKPYI